MMVIQAYASTNNAEEVEVEWFYEDVEDILELNIIFFSSKAKKKLLYCFFPGWMQSQKTTELSLSFPRRTIQYHTNPSLCPNQ